MKQECTILNVPSVEWLKNITITNVFGQEEPKTSHLRERKRTASYTKILVTKIHFLAGYFFLHCMLTIQLSATILEVSVFSQRVNSEIVSKRLTDYQWLCLHVQNFLRSDSKLWFIRKCMIGICI